MAPELVPRGGLRPDPHRDPTLLRELDGVTHQVQHDLPEPQGIAEKRVRRLRRDLPREIESLGAGSDDQRFHRVIDAFPQRERNRLHAQVSGFDLGDIEHVVHDGEERFARGPDELEIFALLGAELGLQRNLSEADDRVQRRADLVAHVGQEVGLRPVRFLGRLLGDQQLRFGALAHAHFAAQPVVSRDQAGGALADLDLEVVLRPEQVPLRTPVQDQLGCQVGALAVQVDEDRHLGLEHLRIHGLHDVVDGADPVAALRPFGVLARRAQEQYGSVAGALEPADQRGGLEAVHLGHAHIEQDEREGGLQDRAQRLAPGGSGHDRAVGPGQQRLESLEAVRLVIDDEDVGGGGIGQGAHRSAALRPTGSATPATETSAARRSPASRCSPTHPPRGISRDRPSLPLRSGR